MQKRSSKLGEGRARVINDLINKKGVNPAPPPATSPPKKVRNAAAISAQRGRRIFRASDKANLRSAVSEAIGVDLGLRHRNRVIG